MVHFPSRSHDHVVWDQLLLERTDRDAITVALLEWIDCDAVTITLLEWIAL